MCVAAGYNEGCHVTTAFPTQGHIQMKQTVRTYETCDEAVDAMREEFKADWLVHSMVTAKRHEVLDGDGILVVYRRDE
jgi:hypothetical protein